MVTSVYRNCARGAVACRKAFTLIEVLVVVAIIALLIAILLPSLAKAKAQTRQANCLSNLRQLGIGLSAYSADHRQYLPKVGSNFKYYMKENYKRKNIGILYDPRRKYVGLDISLFFCPSNPLAKEGEQIIGSNNYGGSGFLDPTEPHTFTAYIYAVPMNWSDDSTPGGERHPMDAGIGCYPDLDTKGQDGDWMLHDPQYRTWLRSKRTITGNANYGKRTVSAILADNYISNRGGPGIGAWTHKSGYNVLFTDFHARSVHEKPMPTSASGSPVDPSIAFPTGPTTNSEKGFESWDYFSRTP